MTPIKPGYATTEFWLTAAAAVCGAVQLTFAEPPKSAYEASMKCVIVVGLVLAALGYTYNRTTAKKNGAE